MMGRARLIGALLATLCSVAAPDPSGAATVSVTDATISGCLRIHGESYG